MVESTPHTNAMPYRRLNWVFSKATERHVGVQPGSFFIRVTYLRDHPKREPGLF